LNDAQVVLDRLETGQPEMPQPAGAVEYQPSLFDEVPDRLREALRDVDPDQLTPIEALALLAELKTKL
jgi:hypothetical protein